MRSTFRSSLGKFTSHKTLWAAVISCILQLLISVSWYSKRKPVDVTVYSRWVPESLFLNYIHPAVTSQHSLSHPNYPERIAVQYIFIPVWAEIQTCHPEVLLPTHFTLKTCAFYHHSFAWWRNLLLCLCRKQWHIIFESDEGAQNDWWQHIGWENNVLDR